MSTFWLKVIAVTTMAIDHIGAVFYPEWIVLRIIGRLAFPIFAFLIAEGAYYTKDLNKYMLRIFGFALISEIPFDLAFYGRFMAWEHQNVMWTFLLALIAIAVEQKLHRKTGYHPLFWLTIPVMTGLAFLINSDYQGMGVLVVLVFYMFRQSIPQKLVRVGFIMILFGVQYTFQRFQIWSDYFNQMGGTQTIYERPELWLVPSDYLQALSCASFPLIAAFNGKKGIGIKYFFYLFYPVHLAMIALAVHLL